MTSIIIDCQQNLMKYKEMTNDSEWVIHSERDGVKMSSKKVDFTTCLLLKREMVVDADAKTLLKWLESKTFQQQNVKHVDKVLILANLSQGHKVMSKLFKSIFWLEPREFIYCSGIYEKDDKGYIISHSFVKENTEVAKLGFYEGFTELTPINKAQTQITNIIKINMDGKVPLVIMKKLPCKFLAEYIDIKNSLPK